MKLSGDAKALLRDGFACKVFADLRGLLGYTPAQRGGPCDRGDREDTHGSNDGDEPAERPPIWRMRDLDRLRTGHEDVKGG